MSKYRKAIVGVVGAVATLVTELAADGALGKYGPIVLPFATAIGVYCVKNSAA